ncbi:MAG: TonB-dependent receptor [Acidobacteria bacterium]|nr:MAG: TonB-dependent receptor [Acidobacteriota bacterium]
MKSARRKSYAVPRLIAILVALIGLIVLGNCPVLAQGFAGTITGTVKDTSGAAVPGAAVTVKHLETGLTRAVQADATGNYSVPSLPVGEYELTAEKMGFQREVRRGINLVVAQEAVVNVTLQVGSIVQQVTVTEAAPLVNTTTTSTSGLITEQQIKELPLNGRSFDQLLTITPGTVNYTSNVGLQGNFFSVVGRRPEENKYTINGIEYLGANAAGQPSGPYGASGQVLGVDAVREFNLIQHSYGAEYGKRAGGQVSIVTDSGTNQLHGSVFEYLRNSGLDARNYFDQTTSAPPFRRNQFGGSLGGPLKKDKLFLFGNYEGFRQRLAVSSNAVVPDAQFRLGLLPCNVIKPAPKTCQASGYAPVPSLATGMLPFASAFWPTPNGPELLVSGLPTGTALAIGNPGQAIREDFGLARFDYTVSAKDSLSVSYLTDNGDKNDPQPDAVFAQASGPRSHVVSLQETHVFSPTLLNTLSGGFTRSSTRDVTLPVTPFPANLSFVTGRVPGQITIGGGVSTAAASSIVVANGNAPTGNAVNLATGSDDVHFTRGKHSFSVGVWAQRVQENQSGPAQNVSGTVAYKTLQAFLQDSPTAFNTNVVVTEMGYRQWEGAWYVKDEIKLKPNLTLEVGLRDEMTDGWHEVTSRCSNLQFDQNAVVLTDPFIGNSCFAKNNAKALWEPRVGVAWDPTGTATWAVRAGFGIYNDLQDNLAFRLDSNPPFNPRLVSSGALLSQIPLDPAIPLPPTCNAQLVAAKANCSIYSEGGVDSSMHTPTVEQWSFTVERAFTRDLALQVSYVGSEAYHTLVPANLNSPYPQVCMNPQGCVSGGVTSTPVAQLPTVPQGTTYNAPLGMCPGPSGKLIACYPNPFVNKLSEQLFEGTSSYNALHVSLVKRATRGLSFKANYTYSKALDYNSGGSSNASQNQTKSLLDVYNLRLSRGIAAFSLQHQFNGNFGYQLPFGNGRHWAGNARGWVDQLIGGWQWNGIVTAQSGFPLTPQVGSNTSGSGDTDNPDVPNYNAAFSGPVILGVDGFKQSGKYFNPLAYTQPTLGTFGNVQRGSLTGPRLVDFDTSLFKKFTINERWSLQFRTEAFNIFNHVNFREPNAVIFQGSGYSSSAGVITSTATTSRQIQFALRLLF